MFTSIELPSTLREIGNGAFSNCSGLTELTVLGADTQFADSCLSDCPKLAVYILADNESLAALCAEKGITYVYSGAGTHTLTLVSNNGDAPVTELFAWRTELTLPEPLWTGHVFSGWYADEALTLRWSGKTMPPRDQTLYAAWDRDVYTLTFDPNGGDGETALLRAAAGTAPVLPRAAREGYRFLGWSLDAEGTVEFDGVTPAGDTRLYARWAPLSENGVYRDDGDHATLIGYIRQEGESDTVCLPETALGLPLTTIAAGAFADSDVKVLYLSAAVTEIESGAFDGSEITAVNLDAQNQAYSSEGGVVYSKDGTALLFFPPVGVTRLILPDAVERIANGAFANSELRSLRLNEGLTQIGVRAFVNTAINRVVLPQSLKTIGDRAFFGCYELRYVEALGTVETVGENAFSGCGTFLTGYGPEGESPLRTALQSVGGRYNAYMLTLILPLGTSQSIRDEGATLMLPEKPVCPENRQFTGWYLDENKTEAFNGTVMPASDLMLYAATEAVFDYETVTDPESGAVLGLRITACRAAGEEIVVPDTIGGQPVIAAAAGAFGAGYSRVTLPEGMAEIADGAFAAGTVLVCAPGSAADSAAAAGAYSTQARQWTLSWDTGFAMMVEDERHSLGDAIDAPVLERSGYALDGWYYDAAYTQALGEMDTMPASDLTLYASWHVADTETAALADSLCWTLSGGEMTVTGYKGEAESVSVPAALHGYPVTSVAESAFAFNSRIIELALPDTVTSVGERAFYAMHSLRSVTLPVGLSALPAGVLSGCMSLETLQLPEGLETIGDNALSHTAITELTLPASLRTIDATALRGCSSLRAVEVASGNGFYASRDGVLYDTADGILVKYPAVREAETYTVENAYTVGAWAFEGAAGLKTVVLGECVYSLGEGAFRSCSGLTALPALGSLVTRIPDECFYGCSSLMAETLPETVRALGDYALANSGLTELTVAASLTEIGASALDKDVVLRGEAGSYAETWAAENGLSFLANESARIETVALTPTRLTLKRGSKMALTVSVTPAEANARAVSYLSGNTDIVRVSENGTVYAVGCGTANVYATAPGGAYTTCVITVLSGLEDALHLPGMLTEIEEEAFAGVDAAYVAVPETVRVIGARAFADCPTLRLVEFEMGTVGLGEDVFANCPELTILAPSGGTVEQYAAQNGIPFVSRG